MAIIEHLATTHAGVHTEDHTGPGRFGVSAEVRERFPKGGQEVLTPAGPSQAGGGSSTDQVLRHESHTRLTRPSRSSTPARTLWLPQTGHPRFLMLSTTRLVFITGPDELDLDEALEVAELSPCATYLRRKT